MNTDWHELVQRYLSETCTPEEFSKLQQALKSDDAVARIYLRYMNLDVALEAQATTTEATRLLLTSPTDCIADANQSRKRWRTIQFAAAVAAVVVMSLGIALWQSQSGVAVEVISVAGAPESAWKPGDRLRLKHLSWVRGRLELRFRSGVMLEVAAPAELLLIDAMQVQVVSGKITADVGEYGKGFVIDTPQARIVDLGTRFGVDASNTEHTDVVVFEGQVELFRKDASDRSALLNAGEAVRLVSHRRTSRIMSVTTVVGAGAWSTQGVPSADAIITDVIDSMVASDEGAKKWPSLRNFYQIVPGGLREQALAFADELDQWSDVPPSLEGADLVRTFAVDGFNWWMQMNVTVQKPCDFFVLADTRNEVPKWLSAEFTNTGDTITLNRIARVRPGHVHHRLEFAVWKKTVTQVGAVKLGPPYANPPADRKSFSPNRMFGIAARPLP
jgi:ferric-dicitrate binding protein FerR (iron transport regulator)